MYPVESKSFSLNVWDTKRAHSLENRGISTNYLFSQNNILFRETGLEGGVTATTKLSKWTVETRLLFSPSSGLLQDWTAGWRRRYQPVHPLLSSSGEDS